MNEDIDFEDVMFPEIESLETIEEIIFEDEEEENEDE